MSAGVSRRGVFKGVIIIIIIYGEEDECQSEQKRLNNSV